jgi:hypothetical protein
MVDAVLGAMIDEHNGDKKTATIVWEEMRKECKRSQANPSKKDAKLAQELGQLQPFVAVFPLWSTATKVPQECMGQLASFGPT